MGWQIIILGVGVAIALCVNMLTPKEHAIPKKIIVAVLVVLVVIGAFANRPDPNQSDGQARPTQSPPLPSGDTFTVITTEATVPTNVPTPPAAAKVLSITIATDNFYRVGHDLFQLQGEASTIDFRFWWTTVTNKGTLDSQDLSCDSTVTTTNVSTEKIIDVQPSAMCSFRQWMSLDLPAGSYKIVVKVILENGASGEGVKTIRVIP